MKNIFFIVIFILFWGCTRVQTLNMESHSYSERPKHVVWIQVAGFSEEHLPLLKFNTPEINYKTSLEQAACLGKMWNYNLYELRPEASRSFLSQITGSRNINGSCADFDNTPAWDFLDQIGYASGILENGSSNEQTLEKALSCSANKVINLEKIRLWRMGPAVIGQQKMFHYQDTANEANAFMAPNIYYDRSCQKGICYSSISNNFKTLWTLLVKDSPKTFFIVRDFNFQKAIKAKDISYAKESLQEIERIVSWLKKDKASDLLIILSGAESLPIEFPLQGKEWATFEKTGKNVFYKNSSLMSPVLAFGAMAENFCGVFEESEMLKRVIFKPEAKKFNWDSINPF